MVRVRNGGNPPPPPDRCGTPDLQFQPSCLAGWSVGLLLLRRRQLGDLVAAAAKLPPSRTWAGGRAGGLEVR